MEKMTAMKSLTFIQPIEEEELKRFLYNSTSDGSFKVKLNE